MNLRTARRHRTLMREREVRAKSRYSGGISVFKDTNEHAYKGYAADPTGTVLVVCQDNFVGGTVNRAEAATQKDLAFA
ncbi:hypothetical protein GLOTRDRAFT_112320 [Gloeophyllum trabeum ATCC 11539]|uniref:Uncharacterized protein n=1 Tax=Gloeophyllum trabeum (strain ATCC 11539 / FP-39264 / Madison 617) TaxID=670483 RepID=S7PWC5_GLOTA|nr:uncharacterized protein GLOTRDRAFT_112320 [Gloeophyllum trabeum ATCC 11539]EPQ51823.1 hypothetical protein GLOTRDRAFT_112320 [Gloeophyllum trabeum ATCC 11539]